MKDSRKKIKNTTRNYTSIGMKNTTGNTQPRNKENNLSTDNKSLSENTSNYVSGDEAGTSSGHTFSENDK